MLTLLETTAAINAIPTEPDIIRQACCKVIAPDASTKLSLTQEIMLRIMLTLANVDAMERFDIAIEVLANTMAIYVRDYNDISMVEDVTKRLHGVFFAARINLLEATRGTKAANDYLQKVVDLAGE